MKYTTNYNLKKPEGTDTVNIDDLNDNADILDNNINSLSKQINNLGAYAVASGTNAYTATIAGITTLSEGFNVKIKFTNANTGASTLNINSLGAKAIVKSNGTVLSSGNIKAGQICNLVYNGSNFQLLGEGGEYGTATASDVLAGKTIGTDNGLIDGTMLNHGSVDQNLTNEGQEYIIPTGYHDGLGKVKAVITGLVASVIKAGTTIGGILGTFTSDATATATQMLAGAIAYVNGNKITGTIPSKGAATITPSTINQTIAAGQYLSGVQTIVGSQNLTEDNIKEGINIFGKIGTLKAPIYTPEDAVAFDAYISDSAKGIYIPNHKYIKKGTTPLTLYTSDLLVMVYVVTGGYGDFPGTTSKITSVDGITPFCLAGNNDTYTTHQWDNKWISSTIRVIFNIHRTNLKLEFIPDNGREASIYMNTFIK